MARAFAFRLEPVLRLRKQREDEHKRVVAHRLREIQTLNERVSSIESAIAEQIQDVRMSLCEGAINVDHLRSQRNWLTQLRRGALETDAELSAQRAILAQEQAGLMAARRDTKVLVRLKERRRSAYEVEQARREQIELDEMSVLRFARAAVGAEAERA